MRNHNGEVDALDVDYNEDTKVATFETDKFSTYAVVYSDAKVTTPSTAPVTGDVSNTVIFIVVLGVAMLGVIAVLRKQKFVR